MSRLAPVPADRREELLDLWVEAWAAALPQIDFSARRAWFADRLAELDRAGTRILGAFDDRDALLGFLTLDPGSGEIDQLCVARPAQRQGLASRLIGEARRLSPQGLALTVNLDNETALAFYEGAGFQRGAEGTNPLSGLRTVRMLWRPIPPP